MALIRVKHQHGKYFTMSKTSMQDTTLSWRAKGILAYLMSHSDNWELQHNDLVNQSREGDNAVRSALYELELAGYLIRKRYRHQVTGAFFWVREVYEEPVPEDQRSNPAARKVGPREPLVENPQVDNPHVENPQILLKNENARSKDIIAIEQNQNSVLAPPSELATQRDFLDEVPDLETAKATEPEDDLLFDNINENRKARGRRAMHREFASLPQKRVWRESTRYLMGCDGGTPDVGQLEKLKEYITQALIAERTDRAALISYIAKCAENQRTGQRSSHGPSFGSSRQDVGVHIPNEKHNLSEVLK